MRAFKIIFVLVVCFYLTSIIGNDLLKSRLLLSKKSSVLAQLDALHQIKPRIIIFGSSPCYMGLNAQTLELALNLPVFNLCHVGYDDLEIFKKVLTHLNTLDIVIYVTRINADTNLQQIGNISFFENFLDYLLPQLKQRYSYNFLNLFTQKGDLLTYPIPPKQNVDAPTYKINPIAIQNSLYKQLMSISNTLSHSQIQPQVFVVSAPLLMNAPNPELAKLSIRQPLPPHILGYLPPLITTNSMIFFDPYHLNEQGREEWSERLIPQVKVVLQKLSKT